MVFFRQEAEDKFPHAQEVDHLGDAEQRGDDQGSTVGSLQEGRWTLVTQNFSEKGRKIHKSHKRNFAFQAQVRLPTQDGSRHCHDLWDLRSFLSFNEIIWGSLGTTMALFHKFINILQA